jgi:hypothetical protein
MGTEEITTPTVTNIAIKAIENKFPSFKINKTSGRTHMTPKLKRM